VEEKVERAARVAGDKAASKAVGTVVGVIVPATRAARNVQNDSLFKIIADEISEISRTIVPAKDDGVNGGVVGVIAAAAATTVKLNVEVLKPLINLTAPQLNPPNVPT
jgi:hypothetical protein